MTVTLADIKAKQNEYREVLKAYNAKKAEVASLKHQFHQAEMELENLMPVARTATHELRQLGAEYALQVEDDFTPHIPGTELPGERIWTPEDSHHPQAFDWNDPWGDPADDAMPAPVPAPDDNVEPFNDPENGILVVVADPMTLMTKTYYGGPT